MRSQWYRNVLAGQAVEVQIHFAPSVRPLDTDEAVRVLADHERRNQKWPVRPAPNWIWPGQQVDGLSLPESQGPGVLS